MPLDGSAGFSPWTPRKQADFRRCLEMIVTVAGHVADKHHGDLVVLDLTAGAGVVDGQPGSPVIIAETLERRCRSASVWCFERDTTAAAMLRERLRPFHDPEAGRHYRVLRGDHAAGIRWFLDDVLPGLRGRLYGLVYVDANRRTDVSFEALASLLHAPKMHAVDLLLNVAATSWWKRIRGVGKGDRFFYDDMVALPKQYRWFRTPVGPPQWTLVLLSNWPRLPAPKKSGFHAEQSPEGQAILALLNLTTTERRVALQPLLPFGPNGTAATPSISDIRRIEPSGPMPSDDAAASVSGATRPA